MPQAIPPGIVPRREWWPDAENLKTIKECGRRGLNFKMTALAVGISASTWSHKTKQYPQMLQAWEAGRALGAFEVGGALFKNATTRATDKDGNEVGPVGGVPSAQVAYMKQVAGWSDKVEVSGPEGGPVPVQIILPSNGHELPKGAGGENPEGGENDPNPSTSTRTAD